MTFFNNFMRDSQTLLDPGDPINHICDCSVKQPLLLHQMTGDVVVPNSTTQNLVRAADLRQITTLGPNPVGVEGVWANMIKGGHGSLFSPIQGTPPSPGATAEMQKEVVTFAVSANAGTPAVIISDKTVVEVK